MKFLFIILIPFGIALSVYSANPADSLLLKDGKISGQVFEAMDDIPMEYVNIVLFNQSDSSMITGGLTDASGNFELKNIPSGRYYLTVDFIGYKKRIFSGLVLSEGQRKLNLGKIELGMSAVELDGTEITAEKMAVEYKLDRKVINVSRDLDVPGSSAIEVLEKAPSIQVDIDDNVTLRGSSSFLLLIDGKPSILEPSEALQQIPASTIENIEIITNPSAKYDPDGTSGIINIVLKKKGVEGFSAMIDGTIGTGDKYGADLYLNYRSDRVNFFGGIEWNDNHYSGEGIDTRESYGSDTIFFKESANDRARLRNGLAFKGGLDYYYNDKTTFSFGGEIGKSGFGFDIYNKINEYTDPSSDVIYYLDENIFRWKHNFYSLNANYQKKFNREGHQLDILGFYSFRDGTQKQDKKETDTDAGWNPKEGYPYLLRSGESGPSANYRLEVDYIHPAGENSKFETGYHFRLNDEEEDYELEIYDYDNNAWIPNELYSKSTTFDRTIHAVYGMFGSSLKGFEYQLGFRGEYTYRSIKILNSGDESLVDRFDYFPTVHLSKQIKEKNQFLASYSRRIDRPRGWFLEPFETYIDENTRRLGNPDLLPEYTDSYELGYLRTLSKGNVSADLFYRKTDNKITRLQYVDNETGILYNVFDNLNQDEALGMEGSFLYDFTKWFSLNLSGSIYHYSLDDRAETGGDTKNSNNWDSRLITTFKLPTGTRIQVNFSYNSQSVTAQGKVESFWYTDLTFRQDFLKKRLSATLKLSDLFGTRKREFTSQGENFYTYKYRKRKSRIFTFTLSYRFNNFKEKAKSRDFDGGEEM